MDSAREDFRNAMDHAREAMRIAFDSARSEMNSARDNLEAELKEAKRQLGVARGQMRAARERRASEGPDRKPRRKPKGGAAVPVKPAPKPSPLRDGAEAPLD
jgi:ElaB/YqjD/DUF883 family membrane-anchored ribosome-binding protein